MLEQAKLAVRPAQHPSGRHAVTVDEQLEALEAGRERRVNRAAARARIAATPRDAAPPTLARRRPRRNRRDGAWIVSVPGRVRSRRSPPACAAQIGRAPDATNALTARATPAARRQTPYRCCRRITTAMARAHALEAGAAEELARARSEPSSPAFAALLRSTLGGKSGHAAAAGRAHRGRFRAVDLVP